MAEQVTDQQTPAKEVSNSPQEASNVDPVPEGDKDKLKDAGDARTEEQKHTQGKLFKQDQRDASNVDPVPEGDKNDKAGDENQPDVQNLTSSSLSSNKEAKSVSDEDKKDGKAEPEHGDKKKDGNDPLAPVPTEQQTGKERSEDKQENESSVAQQTSNTQNKSGEREEQAVVKGESGEGSDPYIQKIETSSQMETPQISDNVESVGPTTQETVEPPVPVDTRSPGEAEPEHGDKKKDGNDPLAPVPTEQQTGKERSEDKQENESSVAQQTSNTEAQNKSGEREEQAVVKNLTSSSLSRNKEAKSVSDEDKKDGSESGEGSDPYKQKIETSQTETPQISDNVESVGPTTQETVEPPVPVDTRSPGGAIRYLSVVMVIVAILGGAAVKHFYQPESPPQTENWRPSVQFLKEMDKLKTVFPNQRAELWNRSRIHLLRHLQTAHPTEPVSLILTSGVRAEKTLRCLARGFASAFSSAFNASVLDIDGASKASQDSDEVKLDIDRKLQGAFEGNTPVAIIHRFEELPPGSTLIFYRYCDHENAAYKKTFLIFTVLLGEEKEIPAESHLSAVEEMVDDHLQNKFLSHEHPVSFDRMDLDKYGGLWSRISHLILPVTTEERIGHEGCEYNRT